MISHTPQITLWHKNEPEILNTYTTRAGLRKARRIKYDLEMMRYIEPLYLPMLGVPTANPLPKRPANDKWSTHENYDLSAK